jgi:prophage regulatory protein
MNGEKRATDSANGGIQTRRQDLVAFESGNIRTERDFDMHDIPETGFLRLTQVLSVIPLGKTCWWEGVKSGRFPKPVKLSERCTAWRAEDIHKLIKNLSEEAPNN